MYFHPKPAASHAAALRPGQLRHVIRVASITGRQPIRDVMLLGHAEPDHVWPYLDVRKEVIRIAFEVAI